MSKRKSELTRKNYYKKKKTDRLPTHSNVAKNRLLILFETELHCIVILL